MQNLINHLIHIGVICIMLSKCFVGYSQQILIYPKSRLVEFKGQINPYGKEMDFGVHPNDIIINIVDENGENICVFSSCGCSEFYISQDPYSFKIDVYSMIDYIWGADCCIEEGPQFSIDDCELKFSISFDKNGITGIVEIIGHPRDDFNIDILDMEYAIENPNVAIYYLDEIIKHAYEKGVNPHNIYDFIEAFQQSVEYKGLCHGNQLPYKQLCTLYKFALKYDKVTLGYPELQELGALTLDLNKYYGNLR